LPPPASLVERPLSGGSGKGLERDGAEGLLILSEVLAEHVEEGLGLLRAEVDALEAANGDLIGGVLVSGAEGEEEVPDAGAHLHAVGVALAIVGGFGDVDPGLGVGLMNVCHCLCSFVLPQENFGRCGLERAGAKGGLESPRVSPPDPKFPVLACSIS
jgi:hypothetical protein